MTKELLWFWVACIPGGHGCGNCADCGRPYAPGQGIAYMLKGTAARPPDAGDSDPIVDEFCYREREQDYRDGKPSRPVHFHLLGRSLRASEEQLELTAEVVTTVITTTVTEISVFAERSSAA